MWQFLKRWCILRICTAPSPGQVYIVSLQYVIDPALLYRLSQLTFAWLVFGKRMQILKTKHVNMMCTRWLDKCSCAL